MKRSSTLTISKLLIVAKLVWLPVANADTNTPEPSSVYTLDQAISTALTNNPDLQITHERIGQAEAQLGEALSSFYPQIQVRMSYEHSDNPSRAFGMIIAQRRLNFNGADFNHPGGTDNYRPEVMATYSLFRGGQDYQASKAAELGIETAQLTESSVRNHLVQAVTSTYYGYLAALEAHKIATNAITAVQSELEQSRIKYEAGTLLKSEVLSLEVELAQAQDIELQTANAIDLTLTGLKTLLGISNNSQSIQLADSGEALKAPQTYPAYAELLDQALSNRPELNAAKKQVEIAEHQLTAAQGLHLPRANAYVSYGSDSKNLDFSTNRDNVTAGVMVEMDVFTGFSSQERIKKAEHQLNEAKTKQTQIQLAIENEVKSAQLKLNEALARFNVTQTALKAADEALRLVNEQRKAGMATVTRYIEAESAKNQAYSRDVSARFDVLRAEADLKKAIGYWRQE